MIPYENDGDIDDVDDMYDLLISNTPIANAVEGILHEARAELNDMTLASEDESADPNPNPNT